MPVNFQSPGSNDYFAILPINPQAPIRWVTEEEFPEKVIGRGASPCHGMFLYADVGCWANRGDHREFCVYRAVEGVVYIALCEYSRSTQWKDSECDKVSDEVLRNLLINCRAKVKKFFEVPFYLFYSNPPETGNQIYFLLGDLHLPVAHSRDCNSNPPGWFGTSYSDLEQRWHNAKLIKDIVILSVLDPKYIGTEFADHIILRPSSRGAKGVQDRDGTLAGGAREVIERVGANTGDEWLSQYYPADIFHNEASRTDPQSFQDPNAAPELDNLLNRIDAWCQDNPNNQLRFVQLGDFYELWIGLTRLFRKDEKDRINSRTGRVLLGIQDDCIPNTRGLRILGRINRSPDSANQARIVINEWLKRVDISTQVWGQSLTSRLFDNSRSNFTKTFLVGNHDSYMSVVTAPGQPDLWAIKDASRYNSSGPHPWPDVSSNNRVRIPCFEIELNESGLHLEHGHSWDPHNRDGVTSGWEITQGAFVAPSMRHVQNLYYSYKEQTPDRESDRQKALEEAVRWHARTGVMNNMALFGMAHTHSPFLARVHYHREKVCNIKPL